MPGAASSIMFPESHLENGGHTLGYWQVLGPFPRPQRTWRWNPGVLTVEKTLWIALGHMVVWKSAHFLGSWKVTPKLPSQQAEFTLIACPPTPPIRNRFPQQLSDATPPPAPDLYGRGTCVFWAAPKCVAPCTLPPGGGIFLCKANSLGSEK